MPLNGSGILTQVIESKKIFMVNEPAKDRNSVNEVRQALGIDKIHNMMLVPFGENRGKHGGAMLLCLLNKFSMGEEGKPTYEA